MKKFKLNAINLAALGIFAYFAAFVIVAMQNTEPFAKVTEQSLPKTVMLGIQSSQGRYLCSGVLISPVGHILTCNHCVDHEGIEGVSVEMYDGDTYAAEVLLKDKFRDLAMIKINDRDKVFPYAKIADPRKLVLGQEVIAIGYPFGLDWTVTHGIISQLHRDSPMGYNRLQTDAWNNPGNSGGPLFNRAGEIVGINSCILVAIPEMPFFIGVGFSVEAGQILEFVTNFRKVAKQYQGV